MKTRLLITVDCGKTTCGKCRWFWDGAIPGCIAFDRWVENKRCDECLRAEKEAKK